MSDDCTPAMLSALTELKRSNTPVPNPLWWPIKSRGWIDKDGTITRKGLDYLNGRNVS